MKTVASPLGTENKVENLFYKRGNNNQNNSILIGKLIAYLIECRFSVYARLVIDSQHIKKMQGISFQPAYKSPKKNLSDHVPFTKCGKHMVAYL